ncbi:hypothetical protein A6R71_13810 [Xanthomonas translucens pv. arrhenatheri]|nr:hypothetical protein A6R71_13810 [Xanthomonas translucens pv. arrhenatheri]
MRGALCAQHHRATGRRERDRVVEQIVQGLPQQIRIAGQRQLGVRRMHLQLHAAGAQLRRQRLGQLREQRCQCDALVALQPAVLLDLGQRQQLVDGLGEALLLLGDVAHKALPLRLRQRFLQQFGGAADRRQRALHLVSQRLQVLLDIGLALELAPHRLQRAAEVADLVAAAAAAAPARRR